jgi:hypothetical protein
MTGRAIDGPRLFKPAFIQARVYFRAVLNDEYLVLSETPRP